MVRAFLYVVSDQFSVFSPGLGELALPSEPIIENLVPGQDVKRPPVFGREAQFHPVLFYLFLIHLTLFDRQAGQLRS